MSDFSREQIQEELSKNVCEVVFTKTDGTERVMKCTLMPELLPEKPATASKSEERRLGHLGVLPVFDLEKDGWRSFRINSVKSVNIVVE